MGSWQGFEALTHFNLFVARIAAASFMAYALGQILDVHVFNRLRQNHRWCSCYIIFLPKVVNSV